MKYYGLRLLVAVLTFCFGLTCTYQYRAYVAYHQHNLLLLRENQLKADLSLMREMIERYRRDKNWDPDSLDDLVKSGYLREVPIDPITGKRDWEEEKFGLCSSVCDWMFIDIRSASNNISSDGRRYDEW